MQDALRLNDYATLASGIEETYCVPETPTLTISLGPTLLRRAPT